MRAALEIETLKLHRSTAVRVATTCVVLGVPSLGAAFMAAARSGGDSQFAVKVRPMLAGDGWTAYWSLIGQVLSVATLLAVGFVVCWSFGREHTDGTFGSLFALPTSRRSIAWAKFAVLAHWGLDMCLVTAAVAVPLGLAVGLGAPGVDSVGAGLRCLLVGVLMVALAQPLGWVASACRGYLPGIAALLGLVVVTQVVTAAGAGAWFPYAAPGMWAGLGGAVAARTVTWEQLALTVPVCAVGIVGTLRWWSRAEVR